jgi:hypothetical protein
VVIHQQVVEPGVCDRVREASQRIGRPLQLDLWVGDT